MATATSATPDRDLFGTANTALIVTGLMLPVGGAISRGVAFISAGLIDYPHLAVTVSPAELAVVGAAPILLLLATFAATWFLATSAAPKGDSRSSRRRIVLRVLVLVATIAGALALAVALSLASGVGYALAFTLVIVIANRIVSAETSGRRGLFGRVTPIRGLPLVASLLSAYTMAAITYGFGGRMGPAFMVTSLDPDVFSSGLYLRVGEDANWLYLASCSEHGRVLEVPRTSVRMIESRPPVTIVVASNDPYRSCAAAVVK